MVFIRQVDSRASDVWTPGPTTFGLFFFRRCHYSVRLMISDYEFKQKRFPTRKSQRLLVPFWPGNYRRVCSEGLQVAYGCPNVQKVVKLLIALALLPSESALEGFELIQKNSVALLEAEPEDVKDAFRRIYEYFHNYWMVIVTPRKFCISGDGRRTNNEVESFHRWL
ncbi:hypothetical protein GHT06_005061 [Daphnia sinensis]|uniref:Uncharacterized protein n=1 Tax=Daphnia sinensis TaxID=1820382 RepID=A0AAD5PN13_9CRUS|nr:hypothetical protein GHT06_005061 [Daphnia sinensis]